jgi:hypothetical protein
MLEPHKDTVRGWNICLYLQKTEQQTTIHVKIVGLMFPRHFMQVDIHPFLHHWISFHGCIYSEWDTNTHTSRTSLCMLCIVSENQTKAILFYFLQCKPLGSLCVRTCQHNRMYPSICFCHRTEKWNIPSRSQNTAVQCWHACFLFCRSWVQISA